MYNVAHFCIYLHSLISHLSSMGEALDPSQRAKQNFITYMAKGNMLLGQARGKVGDIVFSRTNGQQVIKSKSQQVKNPQTKAQMIQRIILNTVAQVYSKMQPICDHSFEGVNNGQDCMSYFMSKNAKLLRGLASQFGIDASSPLVVELGSTDFATNPYIVSKGTLPEIQLSEDSEYTAMDMGEANTYASIINLYGLKRGDQLTFLVFDKIASQQAQFHYARVILDPREEDGTEADLSTAFIAGNAIVKPNPRNENYGVEFEVNGTDFEFGGANQRTTLMRGIIVSRLGEDGQWLRSDCQLATDNNDPQGMSIAQAYENWLAGGIDVESSKYLNNAMRMAGGAVTSGGVTPSPSTVAAPVISGTTPFADTTTVSISAAAGTTIKYTTDGTAPTANSSTYSAPFTLSASATVKAIAIRDGVQSSVATKAFTKSGGGDPEGDGD